MDTEFSSLQKVKNWLGSGSVNIFGFPFAGKDTQATLLGELLDAPVIAGGDILRAYPDQEKIKALSVTGKLFPTDFYLSVVLPYLQRADFVGKPLLLSSVGRWHGEEKPVIEAAEQAGHPIKVAVLLKVSRPELLIRLRASQAQHDRGARFDDSEATLQVRLDEFQNKTQPVIEVYRQKGLLVEVDGEGPQQAVTQRILEALAAFSQ